MPQTVKMISTSILKQILENKSTIDNNQLRKESEFTMVTNTFTVAAATAILASNDFWYMHLYAKDKDFDKSHNLMGDYYSHLRYDADTLMELAIEIGQPIFNPTDALQIIPSWTPEHQDAYDYATIITNSKTILTQYITTLNAARSSTTRSDIQSRLDEMLSEWNKEVNYRLSRRSDASSMLTGFINTGLDDMVTAATSNSLNYRVRM